MGLRRVPQSNHVIVKAGRTNGEARYRQPRVAIDGKGNGLAVWTEIDPNPAVGNDSTWAAALADGTTPAPQLIESYDADITFGGDVAIWAETRLSGGAPRLPSRTCSSRCTSSCARTREG